MRKHSLKKSLALGAMVLGIGTAVAQVVSTTPTSPTSPTTTTPSYPQEATTCPIPRRLHEKPKSFQNWGGLYQDRVVLKLKDDLPLAPMWTEKGPAFKEVTAGVVNATELDALNAILAGVERGLARQHASVPLVTLAKWRSAGQARSCEALADLSQYYRLYLAKGEKLEGVVNALNASPLVELAFLPPIPRGATDIAPTTPDFEPQQTYLDAPSQGGIGARTAWKLDGARGAGVRVIDVESLWNLDHEDLPKPFWTSNLPFINEVATALQSPLSDAEIDVHHGTAVAGELVAFRGKYGVTGIAADSEWGAASVIRVLPLINNNFLAGPVGGTHEAVVADAILESQDHLRRGDVILIEQHSPGPESCWPWEDCGQRGFVPMEYFADCFDAIKQVTSLGTIVVEAAGNGNVDLDASRYDGRFNRKVRDSGAILVGGTSGEVLTAASGSIKPNGTSNSGSRVDVSGWGANVMTTGYGPTRSDGIAVNGANDPNQFYRTAFSGTSSASPLVAGSALSVQGAMIASEHGILTPKQMRDLLTTTGQPQQGDLSRPIGPLVSLDGALSSLDIGTVAAGGTGGSEFTLRCPAGLSLVGIKGKAGWLIDRVQAICGTAGGGGQLTATAGGSGGSDFERRCPAGKVVVGLGGRAGWFIDSLDVQCDDPLDGQTRQIEELPRVGGSGGAVFGPAFCPRNRVGVGLRGRAAMFVDRLQVLCAINDPAPLTSWLSDPFGGTGGSYVNLRCNSDEVLVGVRARGGAVVDRLESRCVRVDASGAWVGSVVTRGVVGGTGGTEEIIQCPNGSAVSGITARAAWYVDRVSFYCRDLVAPQRLGGTASFVGAVGGNGGDWLGHIDCPSDLPARGFAAWGTAVVDRLRLACGI